jgi:cytochrome c553
MRILYLIILGAGLYLPLSVLAGDLLAGKTNAEASCIVCHGLDGQATIPLAANLSGQQKDYLVIQLRAYRSGKRHHDQMSIIAKPLTNEQIDNLAEWYSSIKVIVEMPKESSAQETLKNSIIVEVKKRVMMKSSLTQKL